MATALLLSENRLRNFTDIGPNYNTSDISNAVRIAQEYVVEPLIGKNLYDRLVTDITAGTDFTGDYLTLMNDYITPVMLWASYSELLKTIYLIPRSNGLRSSLPSAGSTAINDQQYQLKQNDAKSKLDFNIRKLDEYLDANTDSFSELSENTELRSDRRDTNFNSTRRTLGVAKGRNSTIGRYDLNRNNRYGS